MKLSDALAIFDAEYDSYEMAAGHQVGNVNVEEHSVYRSSEGSVSNRTYLFTSSSLDECRAWRRMQALAAVLKAAAALKG